MERPTIVRIRLENLSHNMALLQRCMGERPLWPAIKANAYGHGDRIVARHLLHLGYETLCVARAEEAVALLEAGVEARFVLLSPGLPEQAEAVVAHDLEPAVCTRETLEAISSAALRAQRSVGVHVKVDTGMGRIGLAPDRLAAFLDHCAQLPGVRVRGLMSHFPRADEPDLAYSREQLERFLALCARCEGRGIAFRHIANSAALLALPESRLDAARPGIAVYGLQPSAQFELPGAAQLRPVLEWRARISFLKRVHAGTGLSYGHDFRADRPLLVASVPVGYGDGLARPLSGRIEMLVHGRRCRQLGRITMDQTLLDVSALEGRVELGDEAVVIGHQGEETISVEDLAAKLGTINYEVTTAIAERVPRIGA